MIKHCSILTHYWFASLPCLTPHAPPVLPDSTTKLLVSVLLLGESNLGHLAKKKRARTFWIKTTAFYKSPDLFRE
jgi:hypothetical protein